MKIYNVVVDISAPGGNYIVVADTKEEAVDFIRPEYNITLDDEDVEVQEYLDLENPEKGILFEASRFE